MQTLVYVQYGKKNLNIGTEHNMSSAVCNVHNNIIASHLTFRDHDVLIKGVIMELYPYIAVEILVDLNCVPVTGQFYVVI